MHLTDYVVLFFYFTVWTGVWAVASWCVEEISVEPGEVAAEISRMAV